MPILNTFKAMAVQKMQQQVKTILTTTLILRMMPFHMLLTFSLNFSKAPYSLTLQLTVK